ncbi:SURF1 family protein [Kineosporia sp. R_H_3]|uniref:SURF1 family cytochrome oxidase biogenesis protein n=1 Tax=Kineosporia sp. R_H_3 TaxID=1961848 RepID=UPI0013047947|nr:SURF1 family protein [Kineosporia sp. R_H_3]
MSAPTDRPRPQPADEVHAHEVHADDVPLLDASAVPAALRLFRERYWLRAAAGVVLLSVVFVLLGRWQLHRHEAKVERRDRVAANYGAAPAALDTVLATPATELPRGREWTPVRVRGTYDAAGTLLTRNRPFESQYGYEVVVPLRLPDGSLLAVDRGWIPFGESATRLPEVPAAPSGEVEVVVRLRPFEPSAGAYEVPGQIRRIAADEVGAEVPGTLYRAYGVLASEQPRPAVAPRLLPRPDTDLGPHLAYTWNWWGFAVAAYVLLLYYALREVQNRRLSARGIDPEAAAAARKERARRRRVRDEDVEDAALEG